MVEIGDEGLVDLDLVEGERLQIGQRGIAGSEVVHRNADTERFQPAQDGDRAGEISDQNALGDLKFKPVRLEPGFQQNGMHETHKVTMLELHWRQVDCDLQSLRP